MQWNNRFRTGTKFVLWTLFILQILLIGVFWLFQQGFDAGNTGVNENFKVNFIKTRLAGFKPKKGGQVQNENRTRTHVVSERFAADFVIYSVPSGDGEWSNTTCFRQGTVINDFAQPNTEIRECRCRPEWHGKDCGQPEIVWRALMTSKVPLQMTTARQIPHKIVYMITGHFFSLELLELQIKELTDCVDFFIICTRNSNSNSNTTVNMLTKRLKLIFSNNLNDVDDDFSQLFLVVSSSTKSKQCTPKVAYKQFKARSNSIQSDDDIFVISQDDEILNRRAIKYLQYYYTESMGLIRFRLKYNVYGFYWQHPESTQISGALSSFRQLDEIYKSDPDRMLSSGRKRRSMIIGDLNHFGGWHCKFCYQPAEIIQKLQIVVLANETNTIYPKINKNGQIDISYIQNLIASGLYIDGKLGLNKLHRFSDKYYAPEYAEENSWKFENILGNLFLAFNDDGDYENK